MEEYRSKVKRRMQYEFILALVLIPLGIITMIHIFRMDLIVYGSNTKDFIGGFFNGVRAPLVVGYSIFLFSLCFRDQKAWKNEERLKKMRIEEQDEREQAILLKASRKTLFITMYVLLIGVVVAGWFSTLISITLLFVWAFMAVVSLVLKSRYQSMM